MPDKVALVVGASRGIGRQIAVELARNGHSGMNELTTATLDLRERP